MLQNFELIPHFHLIQKEESLNALQKLDCTICDADIEKFYEVSSRVVDLNRFFLEKVMKSVVAAKTFNSGRIVVINNIVSDFSDVWPDFAFTANVGSVLLLTLLSACRRIRPIEMRPRYCYGLLPRHSN